MGIYFKNFPEQDFMLAIFYGEVLDVELEAHITELLKDKYASPGKRGLSVICNSTTASRLSYRAILSAGKRMQQARFRENGKLAIIANSHVGFGLAKVYQVATGISGKDETRVLRGPDLDKAIQWLAVSELSTSIIEKIEGLEHEPDRLTI